MTSDLTDVSGFDSQFTLAFDFPGRPGGGRAGHALAATTSQLRDVEGGKYILTSGRLSYISIVIGLARYTQG